MKFNLEALNKEFEQADAKHILSWCYKNFNQDKIKFSTFLMEPQETGNDTLDLLLFKIHRSAMWSVAFLIFYPVSIVFLYVALKL